MLETRPTWLLPLASGFRRFLFRASESQILRSNTQYKLLLPKPTYKKEKEWGFI
jgi:hypothetical protein